MFFSTNSATKTGTIYVALLATAILCKCTAVLAQQANADDILDFLPAIIATASGDCDQTTLNELGINCNFEVDEDIDLNGASVTLSRGVDLEFASGSI